MARSFISCAVAALAAGTAYGAYCNGSPGPDAQPNNFPINTAAPQLLKTVNNGKSYVAGQPGFEFYVTHLYGSAYDMGYAQGELYSDIAPKLVADIWSYMEAQVEDQISFLPLWISEIIANFGLDVALDLLISLTQPFTGDYFATEMKGISDASGADYQTLLRIHLIGELTQGDCSMFGAWGPATAGNKTLTLRALDWSTDIPAVQYPAVTVYHPESGFGHAFANVGFIGWIGALSGQSSTQMSIHEIGVAFPDATFANESFQGTPFTYLLRDILQFDNGYQDTVTRITTANRTCDLILGAGDGKANTFRAFEYSASVANVFDDTNMMPWNDTADTWHPRIPSVVYYGMDWLCPAYNLALAQQIQQHYGALSPQVTINQILPMVQTGDTHAVVYDLTGQIMYVSFYAVNNSSVPNPPNAYDRQFTQLDLNAMWAEPAPVATGGKLRASAATKRA
jgi:isopenicillin-N N-acyltransferase-like protein